MSNLLILCPHVVIHFICLIEKTPQSIQICGLRFFSKDGEDRMHHRFDLHELGSICNTNQHVSSEMRQPIFEEMEVFDLESEAKYKRTIETHREFIPPLVIDLCERNLCLQLFVPHNLFHQRIDLVENLAVYTR